MVALVERGARRDLLDIYTLCDEGLVTPSECWQLWRRRLELIKEGAYMPPLVLGGLGP